MKHMFRRKGNHMRKIEEIIREYNRVCEDNTMCDDPSKPYIFKNQPRRDKLKREYEALLPENQRMAILLHDNLCHSNHMDQCGWCHEKNGIEHDWTRWTHKKYLEKADRLISRGINIDIIKTVFECI